MAAGTQKIHKPKLHPVFTDPVEGHLAATAIAPKGARLGDLVNPRAVAYVIPKTSSPGAFSDAVRSTHTALFAAHDSEIPFPILSNVSYPCADGTHQRIEMVYHESLDANIVSTTPITIGDKQYTPLSSTVTHIITRFVITDYHFQTSLDFGPHLEQFCSWYFEESKRMGKVIKIEIPLFPTPNGNYEARSQFAVYVKSDRTAEECGIDRQVSLGSRQKIPCRVSWMGAPPFCNYCKGYGHFIPQCPKRLSIICSACNASGHVSFTCARFSARDAQEAKGKEPVRGQSSNSSSTPSTSPDSSHTPSSPSSSSSSSSSFSSSSSSSSSSSYSSSSSSSSSSTTSSSSMDSTLSPAPTSPQSQSAALEGVKSPSLPPREDIDMGSEDDTRESDDEFGLDIDLQNVDLDELDQGHTDKTTTTSSITSPSNPVEEDRSITDVAAASSTARANTGRTIGRRVTRSATASATNTVYNKPVKNNNNK